jgi:hypothetical protein
MADFTMYSDNFCWPVRTLRQRDEEGRSVARSRAMAAGWADHVWTMREWITMPSVQPAVRTTTTPSITHQMIVRSPL